MFNLFVYGTLRKGEHNHSFLKQSKLVSEQCWIYGELHDTGLGYPVLMLAPMKKVYGEVYQVNEIELAQIDELEDYKTNRKDNLYNRTWQTVYTDRGPIRALVYVAGKQLETCRAPIELGDWKEYRIRNSEVPIYYFAYGSCMDDERFKKAEVNEFFQFVMGKGSVEGYKLRFTKSTEDGGKADIVEEGGFVEGKVYLIDHITLDYLYRREGVKLGMYRPTFIFVELKSKQMIEALTFVVVNKDEETAPSKAYALEIIRGGSGVLSEDYLKDLQNHIALLNKG